LPLATGDMMNLKALPFDGKRMFMGGFKMTIDI
jgi:uncharacterized protein YbaA (DUF1428 family)